MDDPVVEPTPEGPWYGEYGLTDPAQINQIKNYASKDDAIIKGLIPAKQKLSSVITPPNPEADDYLEQVKNIRLRIGAKSDPNEYTIAIPEDLSSQISEENLKKIRESAHKVGMLQSELDSEMEELYESKRSQLNSLGEATSLKEKQENERKVKAEEVRDKTWGVRKDQQMSHVRDMAKYFDDGLLAGDNAALSPEVISEKGGLFSQMVKQIDSPVLDRVLAVMYDQMLSEGSAMPSINQGATNEYLDRFEKAKKRYPKRPSVWEEIARDRSIKL